LKNEYLEGAMDGDGRACRDHRRAFALLNFINLFTLLLQLLGQREQ
jgi:hypothetical protein